MLLMTGRIISNILRFKAPRNLMYIIQSIVCANTNASAGRNMFVLDYLVEDEIIDLGDRTSFLAAFSLADSGNNQQYINLNHQTKFITVGRNSGTTDFRFMIYGEFIRASKTELIIEWFRKGR